MAELLFLGTGASLGIPVVGCQCEVCRSDSPLNKRLRPSALIKMADRNLLIDAGPDFRQQALLYHVDHLDGVIFTHAHFDHTAGLDDLRVYYLRSKNSLPCLVSQETARDLYARFSYVFTPNPYENKLVARLDLQILEDKRGEIDFLGKRIGYMTYEQGGMCVNGFRFGNLAFISDIRHYPDTLFLDLQGVEILVVSALRYTSSPLHFSIEEAIVFAERVGAKETWLTHLAHEVHHEKASQYLPPHVRLAYDGLVIDFDFDYTQTS